MSEEMDENKVEMDAKFEPRDVYNFLDCIAVIDTLAEHSLKWTQKLGTVSTPSMLAIQKHLKDISSLAKKMNRRILEHTLEVMGDSHVQKAKHRRSVLWGIILRLLKEMRSF